MMLQVSRRSLTRDWSGAAGKRLLMAVRWWPPTAQPRVVSGVSGVWPAAHRAREVKAEGP